MELLSINDDGDVEWQGGPARTPCRGDTVRLLKMEDDAFNGLSGTVVRVSRHLHLLVSCAVLRSLCNGIAHKLKELPTHLCLEHVRV